MTLQNFLAGVMCMMITFGCNNNKTSSDLPEGEDIDVKTVGEADSTANWITLFDGSGLDHWRNFKGNDISWQVEDGALTTPGGKGDIVSKDMYRNFELEFEWKISEGGNSGVMYLVQEGDHEEAYHTGPEYQIIDAEGYAQKNNAQLDDTQITGANYALQAPTSKPAKPAGEWNTGKIVVNNTHVEHWVNDEKVVEYELQSDEWKQKVSQTKFKEWPEYGMAKQGHIALQDHGDSVWFKNIRIREL